MSDDGSIPGQAPDTTPADTQGEPTPDAGTPPWGDDFDASRAWNTIQTLREESKTAKGQLSEAKQAQELLSQLQSDPDLQAHLVREWGYDVDDEGDYQDGQEPDPDDRLAHLEQTVQSDIEGRQQAELTNAVATHLEGLLGDAQVTDREFNALLTDALQNPDKGRTEELVQAFQQERQQFEKSAIEKYLASKKGPRLPPEGFQGSDKIDFSNEDQRIGLFKAAMEAASEE